MFRSLIRKAQINGYTLLVVERVRLGVQKALRKLAEESALKGGSLVVNSSIYRSNSTPYLNVR